MELNITEFIKRETKLKNGKTSQKFTERELNVLIYKALAEQLRIGGVSNRRELLNTFRTWWWGNREKANDITNNDLNRYLGG